MTINQKAGVRKMVNCERAAIEASIRDAMKRLENYRNMSLTSSPRRQFFRELCGIWQSTMEDRKRKLAAFDAEKRFAEIAKEHGYKP